MASGDVDSYWDLSKSANAKLTLLIANFVNLPKSGAVSKKAVEAARQEVLETYRRVWQKAGSKGKRGAEFEHLDILIDITTMSEKADVKALRKVLTELRNDLEGID